MTANKYKVVLAASAKQDVKDIKKYILRNFKYRELAENFSKKMKKAMQGLDTVPNGYDSTGFMYGEYKIYLKPYNTYLLFFVIDEQEKIVTVLRLMQDGMNWKYTIGKWIQRYK